MQLEKVSSMPQTPLVFTPENTTLTSENVSRLDLLIAAWLHAKYHKSKSQRTLKTYQQTITEFRVYLMERDLELDSPPNLVALAAQAYAASSVIQGKEVSANTLNQRLAILSSFYQFALKHREGHTIIENPIARVERGTPTDSPARALPMTEVQAALDAIDTSTLQGKRDKAFLLVGLNTGRRLSELHALQRQHLSVQGGMIYLTFERLKGGKSATNRLDKATAAALMDYLEAVYVDIDTLLPDAPLWISTSPRHKMKKYPVQVSIRTLANICAKHLGTSQVHTLRHTLAGNMKKAGIEATVIQRTLGHANIATTNRYMKTLDDNEPIESAGLFG